MNSFYPSSPDGDKNDRVNPEPSSPLGTSEPISETSSSCSPSSTPRASRRILVVEDMEVTSYLLKRRIESVTRVPVTVAASSAELNRILEEIETSEILLAVSDLHLPDAPHGETIARLDDLLIPIIVMTGDYSDALRDEILRYRSVIDYFLKGPECLNRIVEVADHLARNVLRKALIAEDSPLYRMMGRQALSSLGFQVLEAENGREALMILERDPEISLLITDYEMPEMNGLDLVWELRNRPAFANLCIIGISARESNTTATQFLKRGANDFLIKPFEREELFCRIFQHLRYQDLLKENVLLKKQISVPPSLTEQRDV